MNSIKLKSRAKINLSIDVLGKREDGYHLVEMIMQTIDLYDVIKIKELQKIYNISKKDITVIFVGRLAKEKNIEFLIKNHEELVKHNKNIKLLIIGDGPDMVEYGELVKKLNLQNNIILGGKVPYADIPCYYLAKKYP